MTIDQPSPPDPSPERIEAISRRWYRSEFAVSEDMGFLLDTIASLQSSLSTQRAVPELSLADKATALVQVWANRLNPPNVLAHSEGVRLAKLIGELLVSSLSDKDSTLREMQEELTVLRAEAAFPKVRHGDLPHRKDGLSE